MQVDFYHLTDQPLDHVLPRIAERVIEGGGRLLIVAEDEAQRAAIDTALWTYTAESFLPHALDGSPHAAAQPVLIAADARPANAARNIALADGIWREEALTFDRAFHFFDTDRIAAARAAWKELAGRTGVDRRYWKQNDSGRWEQAA